jgi:hypothetical protein
VADPKKKRRSTAYAWPTYAGVMVLTAVHITMETAQFLVENGIGGWGGTILSLAVGGYVAILGAILGVDLYLHAADED